MLTSDRKSTHHVATLLRWRATMSLALLITASSLGACRGLTEPDAAPARQPSAVNNAALERTARRGTSRGAKPTYSPVLPSDSASSGGPAGGDKGFWW